MSNNKKLTPKQEDMSDLDLAKELMCRYSNHDTVYDEKHVGQLIDCLYEGNVELDGDRANRIVKLWEKLIEARNLFMNSIHDEQKLFRILNKM